MIPVRAEAVKSIKNAVELINKKSFKKDNNA